MKKRRLWIFRLSAIMLPVIVLAVIEGILRLCHYGYDTRLFVPDPDNKHFLVMNRDISKKYFTIGENATIGNREEFYRHKPRGVLRFFVLGESSSLGFPYMHNGAFPRMLKYRLQFEYPGTTFEIINLSLTAINSYTLVDFAQQAVDYQPDGILVYAGHNEYYGALGVASTSRLGSNPVFIHTLLQAKKLKLVQWIAHVAAAFGNSNQQLTDTSLTLMQRMAAGKSVDCQSELFVDGIGQFDRNMQAMLRVFQAKQVPVYIGTLVSNLGGQKPLGEAGNARAEFEAGEEARLQGDYDRARQHFVMAKEYDNLRFRAPEALNGKIRGYAADFPNVRIIDIQNVFETSSPQGIIGRELILEHVHPNLEGHRLMADAFFDELKRMIPADNSGIRQVINKSDYPFTAFDTICGDWSVRVLKTQWPFNEPPSGNTPLPNTLENKTAALFLEKKINWSDAMQQLYEGYMRTNNYVQALRVIEGMCLELPYDVSFVGQAAKLCLQLNENEKACFYFQKEYEMTSSADAAANLAITLLKLDQPTKALPYIDMALKNAPQRQDFNMLKKITQQIIQLHEELAADPENKGLHRQVAGLYLQMGNRNVAAKYE